MSRDNDGLPMLPPWLSESEVTQVGYEAPVQNLPHDELIEEISPRKRGRFRGRAPEAGRTEAPRPEKRRKGWRRDKQDEQSEQQRPNERGRARLPGPEALRWDQRPHDAWPPPAPEQAPPRPDNSWQDAPPRTDVPQPGLPTRNPAQPSRGFQPLGSKPAEQPTSNDQATPHQARRPDLPPSPLVDSPAQVSGERPGQAPSDTGTGPSIPQGFAEPAEAVGARPPIDGRTGQTPVERSAPSTAEILAAPGNEPSRSPAPTGLAATSTSGPAVADPHSPPPWLAAPSPGPAAPVATTDTPRRLPPLPDPPAPDERRHNGAPSLDERQVPPPDADGPTRRIVRTDSGPIRPVPEQAADQPGRPGSDLAPASDDRTTSVERPWPPGAAPNSGSARPVAGGRHRQPAEPGERSGSQAAGGQTPNFDQQQADPARPHPGHPQPGPHVPGHPVREHTGHLPHFAGGQAPGGEPAPPRGRPDPSRIGADHPIAGPTESSGRPAQFIDEAPVGEAAGQSRNAAEQGAPRGWENSGQATAHTRAPGEQPRPQPQNYPPPTPAANSTPWGNRPGFAPPPAQQPDNPPGAPYQQPSLDNVPMRRVKRAPGSGWRKAVHHVSGGAINPGMSAEELRLQELVARIRQPVRGDYRIAVLSLKGGVGKTTTTMGIGSTFASIRGDRVIAVDANPDFGTLSQRVSLQTRSTVRDLLLDPSIQRYSDVRRHTSQSTTRLEVLASERDPAASEAFSEEEYRAVARILQRFYNIILTDCGTGLMHSAMSGVLDLAHSLVLISSPAIDGARSAAATLDWLSLHGHDHLVRNAVVVINSPQAGSPNVGIQQLREYFLTRCRAVHIIPFDAHMSEGAEIDLHRLHKQTKRAYVELAATVADDFATDHRRYRP
ncbi:AAA family ATPase [Nocardia sp. NPDC049190]|uniref:MinD/ParA family ATP-binding protein n=1 Tax=Nocardia sp. NPDC049190 TaxID=3155650 RepID=UPI003403BF1D